MGRNIWIVTGGAGFIGSCFVRRLNDEGITDVVVVDDLSDANDLRQKNLKGKTYLELIPKRQFLHRVKSGEFNGRARAIVHMGACSDTTEKNELYLQENNYEYSKILAEWSLSQSVRFVYASSAATYGDGSHGYDDDLDLLPTLKPLNLYGESKQRFDHWALDSGVLDLICGFKFFNVYGPNEYHKGHMSSVVLKAFRQVKYDGTISLFKSYSKELADGGQQRDFIYVKDCVDCLWWAANSPVGGLYNLGTGVARTWNDLAHAVFSAMGVPTNIKYIEMPDNVRAHYQNFTEAKLDNLRRAGWTVPFASLESGVKDYVQSYLELEESNF